MFSMRVLTVAGALCSLFCFSPTVMAQFHEPNNDFPPAQSSLATMGISNHTASGGALGNGIFALNCAASFSASISLSETGPWAVNAAIDIELNPQGEGPLTGVQFFDMQDNDNEVLPGQTVTWSLGTTNPGPTGPAGSYSSHAFLAGVGPSGYAGAPASIVPFSL